MVKLDGRIELTGLPPHYGMLINLCFYRVEGPDAPPPYGGDPPTEAATDCHEILKNVNLRELVQTNGSYVHDFSVEHEQGFYYIQVRLVLFRPGERRPLAQAEQFFFGRRTLHLDGEVQGRVTFPVAWPAIPAKDLHHYGTIKPQKSGFRRMIERFFG